MTVDLNTVEHLGIQLYSNFAAVLTEVVANAWDADAEHVSIEIEKDLRRIVITDDGIGMSVDDMNTKYLRIGYARRKDQAVTTQKGRTVMGRKGLGKLSLFSIADAIEVQSAKGGERHGLRMTLKGITEAENRGEQSYYPEPLSEFSIQVSKGTRIVLEKVRRKRLDTGHAALRERLARRVSVIDDKSFRVIINNEPVLPSDRGDLRVTQFLWHFEGSSDVIKDAPNLKEHTEIPSKRQVRGWIGTAERPNQLYTKDAGNLNTIVVMARGRLILENILDRIDDSRFYTKYLTGQIEADFLDEDDEPDIVTSDRQRIMEDDPRHEELISLLNSSLTTIRKQWDEWRRKYGTAIAKKVHPVLREWVESMPAGYRDSADEMIARLAALSVDREEDRKLLFRYGILAFERMKLRGSTESCVESINSVSVDKLLSLLGDRDDLEGMFYRDIVKARLDVVKDLEKLVDNNAAEKALRQYLFDHLWLLDPSWDRASGSEVIESALRKEHVITDDKKIKSKHERVDIAYRTSAGKHIIVELKRANRKMKLTELQQQGFKYVDKLKSILTQSGIEHPNIEVVFVLGKPIDEERDNPERLKNVMASISPGSRIVHYKSLILSAQNAYAAYLEKSRNLDRIDQILEQL